MSQDSKEPAISPKVSKALTAIFAVIIVGGFLAALGMLAVWGLVSLYGLLFG